jgi:hypothetical protein
MSETEFIVAVVAVGGGIALTGFIFHGIFSLIRMAIESRSRNKASVSGEMIQAKEFHEFKNRMEKRVQALEAVVASVDYPDDVHISDSELDLGDEFTDLESAGKGALRNQLRSR